MSHKYVLCPNLNYSSLTGMLGLDVQNQPCQVLSSVLSVTWTSFGTGRLRRRCGLFLSTPFPAFNTSSNWKFGWPCLFTRLKCGKVVFIFSWRWISRAALQSLSPEIAVGAVWIQYECATCKGEKTHTESNFLHYSPALDGYKVKCLFILLFIFWFVPFAVDITLNMLFVWLNVTCVIKNSKSLIQNCKMLQPLQLKLLLLSFFLNPHNAEILEPKGLSGAQSTCELYLSAEVWVFMFQTRSAE